MLHLRATFPRKQTTIQMGTIGGELPRSLTGGKRDVLPVRGGLMGLAIVQALHHCPWPTLGLFGKYL